MFEGFLESMQECSVLHFTLFSHYFLEQRNVWKVDTWKNLFLVRLKTHREMVLLTVRLYTLCATFSQTLISIYLDYKLTHVMCHLLNLISFPVAKLPYLLKLFAKLSL